MDAEILKGLALSPGLTSVLMEIEDLENQNKTEDAFNKTKEAIDKIRISGAILRCKLAEQCRKKGDKESTQGLYTKAIEHLDKSNPAERSAIDAIKRKMNNA